MYYVASLLDVTLFENIKKIHIVTKNNSMTSVFFIKCYAKRQNKMTKLLDLITSVSYVFKTTIEVKDNLRESCCFNIIPI